MRLREYFYGKEDVAAADDEEHDPLERFTVKGKTTLLQVEA